MFCIERWCLSAVCKLCCVRNWGIGWGSLIWVLYMLNCKWWWGMGYCYIFKWSLPFLLYNMTLLISLIHFACLCSLLYSHSWGYWGWKGTIRVLALGRDLWCVGKIRECPMGVSSSLHSPRWIRLTDSSSLTVISSSSFFFWITRTDFP